MIVILDWLIVIVMLVGCVLVAYGVFLQRRLEQVVIMQLQGLGETHLMGFEALTLTLERLEKRIKAVEEEVL